MSLVSADVIDDFVSADLAKPAEKSRLPPKLVELANTLGQSRLNDLLGRIDVATDARQGKPVDPREIGVEERAEGAFIARKHRLDQQLIGVRCHNTLNDFTTG